MNVPGEAFRRRKKTVAKAGADIRGEVLRTLARLRLAPLASRGSRPRPGGALS